MHYEPYLTPVFEKQTEKLKKKDRILYERVMKKIEQIIEQPEHYKPLSGPLAGKRRVHLDPFVIVYEIHGNVVVFDYIKHHDKAY